MVLVRDLQKDMDGGIPALRNDAFQRIGQVPVLEHVLGLVLGGAFRALPVPDGEVGPFQEALGLLPAEVAELPVPVLVHPDGVVLVVAQDQITLYARVYGKDGRRFKFGLGISRNVPQGPGIVLQLVSFPPAGPVQEPQQVNDKGYQYQTDFL